MRHVRVPLGGVVADEVIADAEQFLLPDHPPRLARARQFHPHHRLLDLARRSLRSARPLRLSTITVSVSVKNVVIPLPRARKRTRASVCPTLGSKASGSFP
jgi:hypothetical protein